MAAHTNIQLALERAIKVLNVRVMRVRTIVGDLV